MSEDTPPAEDLDLERLRLPHPPLRFLTKTAPVPPRTVARGHFLKGPVPWTWLEQAGRLPGRAMHVGIVLWHLAGMRRSLTVTFSLERAKGLGVSRGAARRGLAALQRARLVSIQHAPGQAARVTLLESPPLGVP